MIAIATQSIAKLVQIVCVNVRFILGLVSCDGCDDGDGGVDDDGDAGSAS